jgi:ribonuclease PH
MTPERSYGRTPSALRPATIEPGFVRTAAGSALISMGETRVICTASVQASVPRWMMGSGRGWVTAEYGMLPASTGERKQRDVLQADGGTRCASITGGMVALRLACERLVERGALSKVPLTGSVAAVSCGIVGGVALLDLDYSEDSTAEVDANVVMTGDGGLVEVQATAERTPLSRAHLDDLLALAAGGIDELRALQSAA